MPTLFDPITRAEILDRVRKLTPGARPRWGRMNVPQMVAHLTDQMHHALGDTACRPVHGPLRNRFVKYLSIYWIPWPRGRLQGPPDAFVTQPAAWVEDLDALITLIERFGRRMPDSSWPEHALFGPMTGRDWGYFCHKHFHHHLTQFGV